MKVILSILFTIGILQISVVQCFATEDLSKLKEGLYTGNFKTVTPDGEEVNGTLGILIANGVISSAINTTKLKNDSDTGTYPLLFLKLNDSEMLKKQGGQIISMGDKIEILINTGLKGSAVLSKHAKNNFKDLAGLYKSENSEEGILLNISKNGDVCFVEGPFVASWGILKKNGLFASTQGSKFTKLKLTSVPPNSIKIEYFDCIPSFEKCDTQELVEEAIVKRTTVEEFLK